MNLFENHREQITASEAPLADRLSSLIFYGPPGTGKTTLARIIANHLPNLFLSSI